MTPDLIMMIGVAGSGKSTWIKNFIQQHNNVYTVVSTDSIFVEWGAAYGLNYSEAFANFKFQDVEQEFNSRLAAAIAAKENIIWDQTNLTVGTRARKLAKIPKQYTKRAVVFDLPLDEVQRRAANPDRTAEEKHIPPFVLRNMFSQFQTPGEDEFDEIIAVIKQ